MTIADLRGLDENRGPSRNRGSAIQNAADVLAMLMWGPKTMAELVDATGLNDHTIRTYLQVFQQHGIAYVSGLVHSQSGGRPRYVYRAQTTPFEKPDCIGESK